MLSGTDKIYQNDKTKWAVKPSLRYIERVLLFLSFFLFFFFRTENILIENIYIILL